MPFSSRADCTTGSLDVLVDRFLANSFSCKFLRSVSEPWMCSVIDHNATLHVMLLQQSCRTLAGSYKTGERGDYCQSS